MISGHHSQYLGGPVVSIYRPTASEKGILLEKNRLWQLSKRLFAVGMAIAGITGLHAESLSGDNLLPGPVHLAQMQPSSATVTSTTLGAPNHKLVAFHDATSGAGELVSYALGPSGDQQGLEWYASAGIPEHTARNIWVGTREGAGAQAFRWKELTADIRTRLTSVVTPEVVDYLRGDRSREGTAYRARTSPLGDIVHSSPVHVQGGLDMGYEHLPSRVGGVLRPDSELMGGRAMTAAARSYPRFLAAKRSRPGVAFVGANDGMLHAFAADGSKHAGKEVFAFIPYAVLPRLRELAQKRHEPRSYVDGPLTEVDAYWDRRWRNVLLGSTGAGARSIFALDVTFPAGYQDVASGGNAVLWEREADAEDSDWKELGYVTEPLQAGIISSGDWVAVFGNGLGGASGQAQLFVVDLRSGRVIRRIPVAVGLGGKPNGLGGVTLIRNAGKVIIGAYAGDARGHLWKFDLGGRDARSWRVSLGGRPLFQATANGSEQPISVAPRYLLHPRGGAMVLMGTGADFQNQANAGKRASGPQALYGIWDRQNLAVGGAGAAGDLPNEKERAQPSEGPSRPVVTRDRLLRRTASATVLADEGPHVPSSLESKNTENDDQLGWTVALPEHRGYLSSPPQIIGDLALFEVSGERPVPTPLGRSDGPPAWRLFVDPFSGAWPGVPVGNTHGDGDVNGADVLRGWQQRSGIGVGKSAVLVEADALRKRSAGSPRCPAGRFPVTLVGVGEAADRFCAGFRTTVAGWHWLF